MRFFPKNKSLLCFRPVVDIDAMLDAEVSDHSPASSHFPCKPASEKQDTMKISEENQEFFHQGSWIMQHPPKRTICKMIKALVSQTILKRRASHKNRYGHHGSFGSKQSYKETKSPQSPLSTSSSHGSSSTSSSPQWKNFSNSTKEKQNKGSNGSLLEKQKKLELYGICLILISLIFTMFCGKLFGIVMTSMWLYSFPVWNSVFHCQKRFPICPKERQNVKSRSRVIGVSL